MIVSILKMVKRLHKWCYAQFNMKVWLILNMLMKYQPTLKEALVGSVILALTDKQESLL